MLSVALGATVVLLLTADVQSCGELQQDWETVYQQKCNAAAESRWHRRIEKETQLSSSEVRYREYQQEVRRNVSQQQEQTDSGERCERKMRYLLITDEPAAISADYANRFDKLKKTMNPSKICVDEQCFNSLSSLNEAMKDMKDRNERLKWWEAAREATGQTKREHTQMLIQLLNDMAAENGFENMAEQWESYYDDEMWNEANRLWKELKPLYEVLHAWVRMKLNNGTGEAKAIPAHLLGDLWGQDWSSILPYSLTLDLDSADIMQVVRESMLNLGITSVPDTLVSEAEMTSGADCTPAVEGFCTGDKISLVVCERQHWTQYAQLSALIGQYVWLKETNSLDFTFREIRRSASPDLYVALTQVFKLIRPSNKQWGELGKLDSQEGLTVDVGYMADEMKTLLYMALMTFGSLSYNLALAAWRRNLLMGKSNFNNEWWTARLLYQGVEAPSEVSIQKHFDVLHPNAYSINDNFRDFFGEIVTYQIFHSLCHDIKADEDLYNCDVNEKAAVKIRTAMKDGSSVSFQDILQSITNTTQRDAMGLLQYYDALKSYLNHELKAAGEPIGWPTRRSELTTTDLFVIGGILLVLALLTSIWFIVGRRSSRVLDIST